MRLDVAFRVYAHANTIQVDYNGAGDTDVDITAGLYMTAADLAAELETQLQTVDASMACTESDGVFELTADDPFIVTWDMRDLRDWLGFTGSATSNADSHTGSVCPGVWVASLPWTDRRPRGWLWSVKSFSGPRGVGRARSIGKITRWAVDARVGRDELTQARSVVGHLLSGLPATWWRDTGESGAWAADNWYGYVEVALAPETRAYTDAWRQTVPTRIMDLPLEFVEWTE